jgi:SpoVK/Ycf46/Vps4 family AAA+-type ATPase
MPRSDLLLTLVKAGAAGNRQLFRKAVEAMVADERARQHNQLADRLSENLETVGSTAYGQPNRPSGDVSSGLLAEVSPRIQLDGLVLSQATKGAAEELIEEHRRRDLLRSYGLEPRHRMLLVGPPGNGKTALAEAIASALAVPMFALRYEAIIGSFLGETSTRLRQVFEFARARQCVLFFDEFDALGKERGDTHETGEIKRVVSTLLLQIDALPSHVVVITATNHPELLDRAVWRRFQLRLLLPRPTKGQVKEWLTRFKVVADQDLGFSPHQLSQKLRVASFAELEEFCADVQRRFVLGQPDAKLKQIVASRLVQWGARSKVGRHSAA